MSEQNIKSPIGEIRGTAVVRDKDGNIKGSFTFGGPATQEQFDALKASGETHGSNTDHSGS